MASIRIWTAYVRIVNSLASVFLDELVIIECRDDLHRIFGFVVLYKISFGVVNGVFHRLQQTGAFVNLGMFCRGIFIFPWNPGAAITARVDSIFSFVAA